MRFVRQSFKKLASDGLVNFLKSSITYLLRAVRAHFEYLSQEFTLRYKYGSSAPKTYKLIYINPSDIEYMVRPRFYRNIGRYGTYVLNSDWDKNYLNKDTHYDTSSSDYNERGLIKFEDHSLYRSLNNRFQNNLSWEETEFYMRYKKLSQESNWNSNRYHSNNLGNRFEFLENLYSEIKNGGYLKQSQLQRNNFGLIPPEENEVVVSIGRDGSLIQDGGGQHRLMLAKIAGVNQIPARVFVRHREWQKIRCEINNATSISELDNKAKNNLGHPDLAEFN